MRPRDDQAERETDEERKELEMPAAEETTLAAEDDVKLVQKSTTFSELGVCPEICKATEELGFKHPTKI